MGEMLACEMMSHRRSYTVVIFLDMIYAGAMSVSVLRRERVVDDIDSSSGHLLREAVSRGSLREEGWPDLPVERDEREIESLHGGTHPRKVIFKGLNHTFVRKKVLSGSTEAIAMEALANKLYRAVGVEAPQCRYYAPTPQVNNTAYMLCRFISGLHPVFKFSEKVRDEASKNFVLDALIQNYDAGGVIKMHTPRGNLCTNGKGDLVRIDTGGSLAALGIGDWKPTMYNCSRSLEDRAMTWSWEPFSLWDLRQFSELYHLPGSKVAVQATWVLQKKDMLLKAIDDFNDPVKARAKDTFEARLNCLEKIVMEKSSLLFLNSTEAADMGRYLPVRICEGVRNLCKGLYKHL